MDIFIKMKILYVFCFVFILILPASKSTETDDCSPDKSKRDLKIYPNCRKKRYVDDEDVVNGFEMERVSPLYDILRHLPPFEDGWLSNPVTSPSFPTPLPLRLQNESSSYGEFKIEVSKDEEHVVSESGRQFKENSALNWYYSAESYSSVNNFTNANTVQPKPLTTNKINDETSSVKSSTLRRQDEEHVVSHVPGLKGGRGAFLDFNLLESSTTAKIDSVLPPKNEEPKPNITTRYILLQSGRIVAINVTSVAPVLKPNSPGSSNKNPNLPTFYFGGRIRNKNTTKTPGINTFQGKQEAVSVVKPEKIQATTFISTNRNTDITKSHHVNTAPTIRGHIPTGHSPSKALTTQFDQPLSIKPNVHYSKSPTRSSVSADPFTIKPNIVYAKSRQLNQNPLDRRSPQLKEITTVNWQQPKETFPTTKLPPQTLRETSTLDPVQRWWKEMTDAKKERKISVVTTVRPKITTVPSDISIVEAFKVSTLDQSLDGQILDSMKKVTETIITHPTVELTANARSAKLKMTDKSALHFSTTMIPDLSIQTKAPKTWTTFSPMTLNPSKRISEKQVTPIEADLLEPSVPLSEIRHEFVRIPHLTPTVMLDVKLKAGTSTTTPVKNKETSRKPRYRGLSHVNLQAPKRQPTESTTLSPKQLINVQPQFQLTTASYRRPATHFQPHNWWNTASTTAPTAPPLPQPLATTPPRRTRHGSYLRNSVSFQTISPGSLTDRRSLNNETPNLGHTTVESVRPQLEDLLIISFEPTRKSMGMTEDINISGKSKANEEKTGNYRPPVRRIDTIQVSPKNEKKTLPATARPFRKVTESVSDGFLTKNGVSSRTDSGNRMGRHFRNNNSKFQSVAEKVISSSPSPLTTKQPFRVFYFEPKRKKSRGSEEKERDDTTKAPIPSSGRPLRNRTTERVHTSVNRGRNNGQQERVRHTQTNERPSNSRSAKQLRFSPREQSVPVETTTTPAPVVKRIKSSPFIWHRPNVGTAKSIE